MGEPSPAAAVAEPTESRPGVFATARVALRLVDRAERRRWGAVAALAVAVSAIEAVAALLVLSVLRMVTDQDRSVTLPIVGDLRDSFPSIPSDVLVAATAAVVGAFFLVRAGVLLTQSLIQNRVGHTTGTRLAERLLAGYLSGPFSQHLDRNSGEVMRDVTSTTTTMVNYVLIPLSLLISESLVVLAILAVLVAKAPMLTLGGIALIGPPVGLVVALVQRRLQFVGGAAQAATAASLATAQQTIAGFREIRLFGRSPYFLRRFRTSRTAEARALVARAVLTDTPRVIVETVLIVAVISMLALLVLRGDTEEGLAVAGLGAYGALRVMPSLNRAVTYLNNVRFGQSALAIVARRLNELPPPAADEPERQLTLRETISVENVSFRYESRAEPVLDGVSLSVPAGSSVGIAGATGSGKTTLVDIILGLLTPSAGRVTVDGVDLTDHVGSWHRQVGSVPQATFLMDDSVRRNVAFGVVDADIDDSVVWESLRLAQMDDFVRGLPKSLDTVVGERGARLSGGQRQRLAIARALYGQPRVLIFDEGTSALDTLTERELSKAIERLRGERTIITIAHRMSTLKACDQIVVLDGGRVADLGTYDELVARSVHFREMAGRA